jgi:hypothetical protein
MSKLEELSEERERMYWEIDNNLSMARNYLKKEDFDNVLWLLQESWDFTKQIMKELEEIENANTEQN